MIYPLLPVYLSRVLGAGALSLGIIEGVAEAVNSVLKVASGYVSDRTARRRPIVIGGYMLSSVARPFIALTVTWPQVLLVRVLDRTGKGIRGAPRDAMLARFASPSDRGRVFGFHRAMDHAGAIVGPLVATAILFFAPGEYRLVLLTEGAEKALVADLAPADRHGVAFGVYNAALGLGSLAASITFGFLYPRFGAAAAFGTGSGLAAAAATLLMLIRTDEPRTPNRT